MKTKKELKLEYKQMRFSMGVFQIRNLTNNKIYIDSSMDMKSKWNRQQIELKFGSHKNKDLQKEWNEQGADNFTFEVLSELKEKKDENINYVKELDSLQNTIFEEFTKQNKTFYQ